VLEPVELDKVLESPEMAVVPPLEMAMLDPAEIFVEVELDKLTAPAVLESVSVPEDVVRLLEAPRTAFIPPVPVKSKDPVVVSMLTLLKVEGLVELRPPERVVFPATNNFLAIPTPPAVVKLPPLELLIASVAQFTLMPPLLSIPPTVELVESVVDLKIILELFLFISNTETAEPASEYLTTSKLLPELPPDSTPFKFIENLEF
jgi:hypothetical protein